jgi:hypothetical protein
MSSLIFISAGSFFTASIVCAVCYGVALRDCRQSEELGHSRQSPVCLAASIEAGRLWAVGATSYALGLLALAAVFWPI